MPEVYERVDDLQRDGLQLIQDRCAFCFGVDAVLLSDFARIKKGSAVLDVGCAAGIIPVLLSAKTEAEHIIGIELQESQYRLFERNIILNGLEGRLQAVWGDFMKEPYLFQKASFDHITCNPPYKKAETGLKNPNQSLALARHEIAFHLPTFFKNAALLLKTGGRISLIHRPERLVDILCMMRQYRLEPKRVRFVYPKADRPPTMVLIEGARGERPFLKTEAPLIIYHQDGSYTKELLTIYGRNSE